MVPSTGAAFLGRRFEAALDVIDHCSQHSWERAPAMIRTKFRVLWAAAPLLLIAACHHAPPAATPPPEVGVVTVHATSIPVSDGYPGRLAATRIAQVRARVTGIVLKRVYREGTNVKAGQVLFEIDPAPLKATLRAAEGDLAQAEAAAQDAKLNASRAQKLGAKGLLAKQSVDDSVAADKKAAAAVTSAKAAVKNAKIKLGYATVKSPISGRAGRASVTQGALVAPGDTNPLTTVQVIDPIYANFSEPMAQVEKLQHEKQSGDTTFSAPGKVQVQIVLPDGQLYGHSGTVDFTDLAVDPNTGEVDLRAIIPNPQHQLLPGMFVQVQLRLGVLHHIFQLPSPAVQHDSNGAFVFAVSGDNTIVEKRITVSTQRHGTSTVTGGLENGQQIVVSGTQKVHIGEPVRPVTDASIAGRAPSSAITG